VVSGGLIWSREMTVAGREKGTRPRDVRTYKDSVVRVCGGSVEL